MAKRVTEEEKARMRELLAKEYHKAYCQTPEYKAKQKERSQTPEYKEAANARRRTPERRAAIKAYYHTSTQRRLSMILRSRIAKAINRDPKSGSAVRDLGCTINELKAHLEAQFVQGMTWDNWAYDGWHIDHIKPLASFDLADREQFLQACHYTNLQPLWAEENLSKNAKAPAEWRERQLATA